MFLLLTLVVVPVWAGTALAAPPHTAEISPPEPPKTEQALLTNQSRKPNKTGKPYRACGKTYHPLLTAYEYQEKGIASWYGPSFHGRHTSCGEVFDMYKLSAAHKLLPMHTKIKVTNLENGKSLTLTVNDRGPFVPGRVLDLSYAAAKSLAMVGKGQARIRIRTSGPVEGQHASDLTGEFCVHVGSFEAETDALSLLEDMKSLRYKASTLKVVRADRDGEIRWTVEVGPYKSMSDADKAESKVVKDYPSAFVVAKE
jgi:rare lipoprotein A